MTSFTCSFLYSAPLKKKKTTHHHLLTARYYYGDKAVNWIKATSLVYVCVSESHEKVIPLGCAECFHNQGGGAACCNFVLAHD